MIPTLLLSRLCTCHAVWTLQRMLATLFDVDPLPSAEASWGCIFMACIQTNILLAVCYTKLHWFWLQPCCYNTTIHAAHRTQMQSCEQKSVFMSSAAWMSGMPRRISSQRPAAEAKLVQPIQKLLPAPAGATRLSSQLKRLLVNLSCGHHTASSSGPQPEGHRQMHSHPVTLSTCQQLAYTKQALLMMYQTTVTIMKPFTQRPLDLRRTTGRHRVSRGWSRQAWLSMNRA